MGTAIAAFAVVAFAAFRIAELTRYSLWYDELFSVMLATSDWSELLAAVVADRTNPPLFYVLLKLWIGIGGLSAAWLRLLPCLIAIAAAWPLLALARQYKLGHRAAFVALATAAASPLLVTLANEIRAYSLLFLLSTASLWAFRRFVRIEGAASARDSATLVAIDAALVYTHYFGWLVVGAECVAALLWHRGKLKPIALGAAIVAALFAPWAWAVWREIAARARPLENVEWITRPGFADLIRFYDALTARVLATGWEWLGAVIVGAAFLALVIRTVFAADRPRRKEIAELALFALLPVLVVFGASLLFARSAFVPRYLIVAAPAWFLLIGLAVEAITSRRATVAASALATVAASAFVAFTLLAGAAQRVRGGEKIPWESIVSRIEGEERARGTEAASPLFVFEGFTALPVAWYIRDAGAHHLRLVSARSLDALDGAADGWVVYREHSFAQRGAAEARVQARRGEIGAVIRERAPNQEIVAFRFSARRPALP